MHEEQENIVIIDPDMAKLFGSDQTISFLIDKVILTFFRDHKIKRTFFRDHKMKRTFFIH